MKENFKGIKKINLILEVKEVMVVHKEILKVGQKEEVKVKVDTITNLMLFRI